MVRQPRVRGFIFSINHYKQRDIDAINELNTKYTITRKGVGEYGTPYIEGFVLFNNRQTGKLLTLAIPRGHIQLARGTPIQNKHHYEMHEEYEEIEERGQPPLQQGARSDLDDAIQSKMDGASATEMLEEYGLSWARYSHFIQSEAINKRFKGIKRLQH